MAALSQKTGLVLRAASSVFLASALLWVTALPALSDGLFKHRDKNGVVTFSDAPVVNGQVLRTSYLSFTRQPETSNPCLGMTKKQLEAKGHALNFEFLRAAEKYSVDPALLKAVARAESCFNPKAVSRAGAKGLMQLMPGTAKAMGVTNILDKKQNLIGGAQYLATMLARYSFDKKLALAAYNAGPGNVDKYNGIPPFDETHRYIDAVNDFYEDYAPQFQP
ncbi:MAG: transglycosylase SLT domain-containing protein [Granulosicoccus sp.]